MNSPTFNCPTQLRVLKSGHTGYLATDKIVNISELSDDNIDLDTTESLLVLMPLYCKRNMKKDDHGYKFYNRGKEVRSSFDRIVVCMDVMGIPGQNIVVFLIGEGRNENLFNGCLKERDTGDAGKVTHPILFHS